MKCGFILIILSFSLSAFSMADYLKCTPSKWKHGHIQVYNHLYQHQQKYTKHRFFRFFLSELVKESHKEQGIKYLYFLFHKERNIKAKNYYKKIANDLYKIDLEHSKFNQIKNTKRIKTIGAKEIQEICAQKLNIVGS